MPSKSALHWRNLRPLSEDAFEIFEAGGFSGAACMSNMGPDLPLAIASRYPQVIIISRLYWPAGELPNANDAVAEWTPYIEAVRGVCKKFQILNETRKEYPDADPEYFSVWFTWVRDRLAKLFPDCEFGFPMPEVIGEDAWDYIIRSYIGIHQADFIAEHCYWDQLWQATDWNWGARYLNVHDAYPGKPIYITEYGCSADLDPDTRVAQYRAWLLALPAWITFSAAYIQQGADGWERFWISKDMAQNMILADDSINNINGGVMLRDQFPSEYSAWIAAGGDTEADFRSYLMATGRIRPTQVDYESLADKAKSHIEELKLIGLSLPRL